MTIMVFDKLLKQAAQAGIITNKAVDATEWLREKATKVQQVNTDRVIQQGQDRGRTQLKVGQMFLFKYDPKYKDKLPYHDRFPLIFPFRKTADGFYGINMHYLPLTFRAILMDNLYQLINNFKSDETTKLRMTYSTLAGASKFRYFKPCVKYYLNNHVQSKFIYISPTEWDVALFLPLHSFKGASIATVHRDSKRIITGR